MTHAALIPRPPREEIIEVSTALVWRDARGFVVCDQVPRALQTWDTACEMMQAGRRLQPEGNIAMVVLSNESRTTRGARQAFAELGATQNACVALVVRSRVSEITGNFFLRINRPPFPMRLFEEADDAIEWALGYVGR